MDVICAELIIMDREGCECGCESLMQVGCVCYVKCVGYIKGRPDQARPGPCRGTLYTFCRFRMYV